jgi:ABC-type uncharacterized transport system fused permease/ATPase subunit
MSRVNELDYFLKNFIAKSLAIIASKESKFNFDNLIGITIDKINNNINNETNLNFIINDYLRLLFNILKETDNTVYYVTGILFPIIMRVFVLSNVNYFLFNN